MTEAENPEIAQLEFDFYGELRELRELHDTMTKGDPPAGSDEEFYSHLRRKFFDEMYAAQNSVPVGASSSTDTRILTNALMRMIYQLLDVIEAQGRKIRVLETLVEPDSDPDFDDIVLEPEDRS